MGQQMHDAVLNDDWATIALTISQLGSRLKDVDVPVRHHLGAPWEGAFQHIK
jgi:hypothetical protein